MTTPATIAYWQSHTADCRCYSLTDHDATCPAASWNAAAQLTVSGAYEPVTGPPEQHATDRLFEPAPEQLPGQTIMGDESPC